MSPFAILHVSAVFVSYASAIGIAFAPIGSRSHKLWGRAYAGGMLTTALSGFGMYNFGGPSMFHIFSIVTITGITLGLRSIWKFSKTRDKKCLAGHYFHMAYSFMGLNMAAAGQALRLYDFGSFDAYLIAMGITFTLIGFAARALIRGWFRARIAPRFGIRLA